MLYKTRLHWILYVNAIVLTLVGIVLAVLLTQVDQPPWAWYVGVAVAVAGALWWLVRWIELRTSEFAVTSMRLIFKVGLVARYTTELLLAKVESISVTQGLLGRMLNYGDLIVTGTGGAREGFPRVQDPGGFRNQVQRASATSPSA